MRTAISAWAAALLVTAHATAQSRTPTWHADSAVRIGGADAPDQAFSRIGQVLIAPAGEILVSDLMDRAVVVLDAQGRRLRSIGREGRGPGEFTALRSSGLLGDTLYAADQSLLRLSYFTLDGQLLRTLSWSSESGRRDGVVYMATVPRVLASDGAGLVEVSTVYPPGSSPGTVRFPFLRLDRAGRADTIAWRDLPSARTGSITKRGAEFRVGYNFVDYPIYSVLVDGTGLVIVERPIASSPDPSEFRVRKIGPRGNTVFSKSYRYTPQPLPASEVRRVATQLRATYERDRARGARSNVEPPSVREFERALRDVGVPRMLVPVTAVASGHDGTIWLRAGTVDGAPALWYVLGPDGDWIATLTLPGRQSVAAVRQDVLVTIETDSLDVPYVTRYKLRRR